MAPSPTGFLHIGNVHTALFNWLFARHEGGEFRLRIENTDTSREVAEASEQIQESLRWLGLEWDGPVTFQLDRMERCQEEARRLVEEGKAYQDEGAIRIRMPDEGATAWNDLIRAVGGELPRYAHVSHVLGADGKSLSKRHGSVTVDEFRHAGYYAPALLNFLALLGWSYDDKTTIMSRDELVERFTLDRVVPSPATFDYEKLDWLNGMYLRALPPEEYADELVTYLRGEGYDWDAELVRRAAPVVQEKIERFGQFPEFAGFLFRELESPAALGDGAVPVVVAAREQLDALEQPR